MLLRSKQPCPDCGSSDALAVYDNGTHCFSCNKDRFEEKGLDKKPDGFKLKQVDRGVLQEISKLNSGALPERLINAETAAKYGVKVEYNESTGVPEKYYFPYYKDGVITGYKVRGAQKKEFYALGSLSGAALFGQNLVSDGGRLIIVTEGEMDALAASQMLKDCGKNYKIVSIPNGAQSASRALKDNLEFLEKFDTVMLNFDSDEHGLDAVQKAQGLFSPGKVKIMKLPE